MHRIYSHARIQSRSYHGLLLLDDDDGGDVMILFAGIDDGWHEFVCMQCPELHVLCYW